MAESPYVESVGPRVGDELVAVEQFSCLAEAKVMVGNWREDDNHCRLHSALGMLARTRFAHASSASHDAPVASLRSPDPLGLDELLGESGMPVPTGGVSGMFRRAQP